MQKNQIGFGKRPKNPLFKRVWKDLLRDWKRYFMIFIVILLERQNNLKDLKSSRNSIIQRIVIMNMHPEPMLQGMPEIFNRIQFG